MPVDATPRRSPWSSLLSCVLALQSDPIILEAEGQQKAQALRAQGYAKALDAIFNSAQNIDQKTMTLQYFEALKDIGKGASTKYIFPMEFTSLIENFVKGKE